MAPFVRCLLPATNSVRAEEAAGAGGEHLAPQSRETKCEVKELIVEWQNTKLKFWRQIRRREQHGRQGGLRSLTPDFGGRTGRRGAVLHIQIHQGLDNVRSRQPKCGSNFGLGAQLEAAAYKRNEHKSSLGSFAVIFHTSESRVCLRSGPNYLTYYISRDINWFRFDYLSTQLKISSVNEIRAVGINLTCAATANPFAHAETLARSPSCGASSPSARPSSTSSSSSRRSGSATRSSPRDPDTSDSGSSAPSSPPRQTDHLRHAGNLDWNCPFPSH